MVDTNQGIEKISMSRGNRMEVAYGRDDSSWSGPTAAERGKELSGESDLGHSIKGASANLRAR
jgi:hypothetical protein